MYNATLSGRWTAVTNTELLLLLLGATVAAAAALRRDATRIKTTDRVAPAAMMDPALGGAGDGVAGRGRHGAAGRGSRHRVVEGENGEALC